MSNAINGNSNGNNGNGNSNNGNLPAPVASSATTASTIGGIATNLSGEVLDKKTRRRMTNRSTNCPDELVNLVCQVALDGGGNVLGMPYDVQAAKDGLTQVGQLQTQLLVARQLVQRLEDEVIQTRVGVADPTFAIYTALRRLTKTEKGNALLPAYQQMQQAVKNRPRKARGPAKPKEPGIRELRKAAKEAAAAAAAANGAKASGAAASAGTGGVQQVPPATGGTTPKA